MKTIKKSKGKIKECKIKRRIKNEIYVKSYFEYFFNEFI